MLWWTDINTLGNEQRWPTFWNWPTLLKAFSWNQLRYLKFDSITLFLMVHSAIDQHRFRKWLAPTRHSVITWANGPHSSLAHICVTRPQGVNSTNRKMSLASIFRGEKSQHLTIACNRQHFHTLIRDMVYVLQIEIQSNLMQRVTYT